jgi:hypothetical protein
MRGGGPVAHRLDGFPARCLVNSPACWAAPLDEQLALGVPCSRKAPTVTRADEGVVRLRLGREDAATRACVPFPHRAHKYPTEVADGQRGLVRVPAPEGGFAVACRSEDCTLMDRCFEMNSVAPIESRST